MTSLIRQTLLKIDTQLQSRMSDSLKQKWNHPAGKPFVVLFTAIA